MSNAVEIALKQIKETVAERRRRGEYPIGLEAQLEAEFSSIITMSHRQSRNTSEQLRAFILHLETTMNHVSGRTATKSRIPGVGLLHKVIAKMTARQTLGLTGQVREVHVVVSQVLSLLSEEALSREDADKRMVYALSRHVLDKLAVIDHVAIISNDLERRLLDVENSLRPE